MGAAAMIEAERKAAVDAFVKFWQTASSIDRATVSMDNFIVGYLCAMQEEEEIRKKIVACHGWRECSARKSWLFC
jgi:hypothetical protein